jgi:hypothetical protein
VIVREVRGEEASQVPLAENDDVIQALAPDRADESLGEGILPRAVRGRENFTDSHALHTLPEGVTVDCVAVAQEVGPCGIVGEGVHDLLGGPVGGGMLGHIEIDDPAAVVGEHDENEEHAPGGGRRRGHRSIQYDTARSYSIKSCAYRFTSIFWTFGIRLRSSSKTPRVSAQPPQT